MYACVPLLALSLWLGPTSFASIFHDLCFFSPNDSSCFALCCVFRMGCHSIRLTFAQVLLSTRRSPTECQSAVQAHPGVEYCCSSRWSSSSLFRPCEISRLSSLSNRTLHQLYDTIDIYISRVFKHATIQDLPTNPRFSIFNVPRWMRFSALMWFVKFMFSALTPGFERQICNWSYKILDMSSCQNNTDQPESIFCIQRPQLPSCPDSTQTSWTSKLPNTRLWWSSCLISRGLRIHFDVEYRARVTS